MTPKSYFTVKNLMFSFKDVFLFFDNVNVSFKPHALNFIQGKNGVGKSTFLRVMQGDIRPDEQVQGTLCIDNNVYDLKNFRALSHQVAMVSQNFNAMLVDSFSFKENLQFALMHTLPGLQRLPQSKPIPQCVEKYGINHDAPISLLSGGQRQILSILMMLQRSPKVLFLDEPTAALDEENAQLIMDFLAELCVREHITVVLIVHNKEIVQKYCGNIYFELKKNIDGGRILVSVVNNSSAQSEK